MAKEIQASSLNLGKEADPRLESRRKRPARRDECVPSQAQQMARLQISALGGLKKSRRSRHR